MTLFEKIKNINPHSYVTLTVFKILLLLFFISASYCGNASAQESHNVQTENLDGDILNNYGMKVGSVSNEGIVASLSGRPIGSVDDTGKIFNVSNIFVGKVAPNGKIVNQAGTNLGSVNSNGEIYNISGIKIGGARNLKDIRLLGAAARLLLF